MDRGSAYRIIGIDPGYGRVGWGVIEEQDGEWTHVAHGCIETGASDPFVDRLLEIHAHLKKLIQQYAPTRAGVEELFFYKNEKTAINVGQARGVILLTLSQAGLPVDECTPLEVKQSVVGYGRAEKRQVQKLLQMRLRMRETPTQDDAADALAVALTCAVSLRLKDIAPPRISA